MQKTGNKACLFYKPSTFLGSSKRFIILLFFDFS